jgi:predicted dehydrogenase
LIRRAGIWEKSKPSKRAYIVSLKDWGKFDFINKPIVGPRLFVDAILSGQPLQPNFYDGYKSQQVIQAGLESVKAGKAINIK